MANRETIFDVAVIGLGAMGSAAVWQFAEDGQKVLGLEAFASLENMSHSFGSSHGETRAIRMSYFEDPNYVPLLNFAYQKWEELEKHSGKLLFEKCGMLYVFPAKSGVVYEGLKEASEIHKLELEEAPANEWKDRFPSFHLQDNQHCVFEKNAGYLRVEECVHAMNKRARELGAQLHFSTRLRSWNEELDGIDSIIRLKTDDEEFLARKVVFCVGAWSQEIIRDLKIPVKVHANFLHWFQVETPKLHSESPCYVFEKDYGFFYGFPSLDGGTVKIAAHSPGVLLETAESERPIQDPDYEALERFGKESLRSFQEGASSSKSCLYSMTPDENFIVDRHPNFKKVFFAAGFSGHGFKFSPAIGRLLLQITREESEPFQSEFLRFDRFR